MGDKLRQMEDEMSRFEAEIGGQLVPSMTRPVIGVNTYNQVARQLQQSDMPSPVVTAAAASLAFPPILGFPPPPPPPPPPAPPLMIPAQVARQGSVPITTYSSPAQISTPFISNIVEPILSATPKTFEPAPTAPIIHPEIIEQIINTKIPEDDTKKKPKVKGVSTAAELAISQGKASSIMANASAEESHPKGKGKKNKKIIRMAGGQTWEDPSLLEWDEDDFRIFCGDLGNDVTDEMLVRVFGKYSSFQKAKVVRDKRTNKTKGFGFVSFKDPQDFIKAMKEMNEGRGCYIFENGNMLHGHYLHVRDTSDKDVTESDEASEQLEITEEDTRAATTELRPQPLKKGVVEVVWRSRCVTPYSPELMPPEPTTMIDPRSSVETLSDVCNESDDERAEEYLKRDVDEAGYEDEYVGEEAEDEMSDYLKA